MKRVRLSFVEAAMETAKVWANRSEDPYKKVGACILDNEGRVLSVGYNGLKPKFKIENYFWRDRDYRRDYIIHAEINALSTINRKDNPDLIAVTLLPCTHCTINIACYGIKTIVYNEEYEKDQKAKKICKFYNIKLIKI